MIISADYVIFYVQTFHNYLLFNFLVLVRLLGCAGAIINVNFNVLKLLKKKFRLLNSGYNKVNGDVNVLKGCLK